YSSITQYILFFFKQKTAYEIIHVAIGAEEVFPAVVVVVDEAVTPAGKRLAQSHQLHFGRDVTEEFATLVAKQTPDLAHEVVIKGIHPTVVVKVLGVGPHRGDGVPIFV